MNATQANALSLSDILRRLGYQPQKGRSRDRFYLSPFRHETMPSFHVNATDNLWYDFGASRGGDVVDFACAYLESRNLNSCVSEALRFLGDLRPFVLPRHVPCTKTGEGGPALEIVKVYPLRHWSLLDYLAVERKIPLDLARKYLLEVEALNRNTGKTLHAIGMRNADEGFELRNEFFKGVVGRKDVTVIRGTVSPAPNVHVFEGFMDMLSALADQEVEVFPGDTIILHSLACLSQALAYIENYESYKCLFSWLDNDPAGEKASRFLQRVAQRQRHLDFCAMNATYAPFKDVNECRVRRLGLAPSR